MYHVHTKLIVPEAHAHALTDAPGDRMEKSANTDKTPQFKVYQSPVLIESNFCQSGLMNSKPPIIWMWMGLYFN